MVITDLNARRETQTRKRDDPKTHIRSVQRLAAERFTAIADSLLPFGTESCEWHRGPVGLVRRSDGIFVPEDDFDRQPVEIEGGRGVGH